MFPMLALNKWFPLDSSSWVPTRDYIRDCAKLPQRRWSFGEPHIHCSSYTATARKSCGATGDLVGSSHRLRHCTDPTAASKISLWCPHMENFPGKPTISGGGHIQYGSRVLVIFFNYPDPWEDLKIESQIQSQNTPYIIPVKFPIVF